MEKEFTAEEIVEIQYELGSECCGANLWNENDGIGICSSCQEWSNYVPEDEIQNEPHLYI